MKILVTGASGFIGEQVVREALDRGHRVLALSRSSPSKIGGSRSGLEHVNRDLSVDGELNLDGTGVDVVVHLAASLSGNAQEQYRSTVHGTENLLDAMKRAGIRRLIGISSIAVLDYVAAAPMSIIDECNPVARDETQMGRYAALKARQEALFAAFAAASGNHCVILRPALVFDETHLINAHAGIVKGPLRVLAKHEGVVPVVAVAGVARAILSAVEQEVASGQVIHLVDDALPNQKTYLAGLRGRRLLPAGGVTLPWRMLAGLTATLYGAANALGLRDKLPEALLPQSFAARMKPFRYANTKARQLLGWVPGKSFS